ncbi:MAG: hypothetical protein MMC23_003004 [Stictis urceolatum]|nr:hypothetical protein [Stictis urceolata]
MSNPIDLREARLQDAAQLSEFGSKVFTLTYGYTVSPEELQAFLEEKYSIAATTEDITNPKKNCILATTATDTILGFVLLTRGTTDPSIAHLERAIELQRLYVDTNYHGKGIGKTLAHEAERIARKEGFKNIWLGVWEEAHNPQRVYERLGYRIVGKHDFAIGQITHTDHIMMKEL